MNKVYINVNESDIYYRFQNFKFYFSSKFKRELFIKKLENNFHEYYKFINRYMCDINRESFDEFYAFDIYFRIEKRGFKVEECTYDFKKVITTYDKPPVFILDLAKEGE